MYERIELVPFDLGPDGEKKLTSRLDRTKAEREPLERRFLRRLELYNGEARRLDSPSPWQPDIDTETTFLRVEARISRLANAIVQQKPPFIVQARDPSVDTRALERFLEWKITEMGRFGKQNFHDLVASIVKHVDVFGLAVVKVPFIRVARRSKQWAASEALGQGPGLGMRVLRASEQIVFEGALPEVVHPADFFWSPLQASSIEHCDLVAERKFVTERQFRELIESGLFRKEAASKVGKPRDINLSELSRALMSQGSNEEKSGFSGYEIFEVYHRAESGDFNGDVISYVEAQSGIVLGTFLNFFSDFHVPYLVLSCDSDSGIIGKPIVDRLAQYHYLMNAISNIEIETAAMTGNALAVWDGQLAEQIEGQRIPPNTVLRTTRPPKEVLQPVPLGQGYTQMPQIREWADTQAHMLAATSLPMFGIEPVNRPTAAGTIREIHEAQQPLFRSLDRLRDFLGKIALAMIARDRQFFPEGEEIYVASSYDAAALEALFVKFPEGAIEREIVVSPKASSSDLSRDARRELVLSVLEQLKNTYGMITGMVQAAVMQPTPASGFMIRVADAITFQLGQVLQEFEIPNIERLVVVPSMEVQNANWEQQQQEAAAGPPGGLAETPGAPVAAPAPVLEEESGPGEEPGEMGGGAPLLWEG